MTPIIPWAAKLYRPLEPYAYTLIRAATGAIFIPHGIQKLFFGTAGGPIGYVMGGLELLGGLLIVLGILVRPMALMLIIDVLMVIVANMAKGWLWTRGGVQYHTFLLGMVIAVFIGGAGRHAVGSWVIQRFDDLLAQGYDRDSARFFVADDLTDVLATWGARRKLSAEE